MKKYALFSFIAATMLAFVQNSFGQGAVLIQPPLEDLLHPRLPSPPSTPAPFYGISPIIVPGYPIGSYVASPVPEPGVLGFLAVGGAMIVWRRKVKS